ncbi:MAG TPA: type II CAAX endopeptidase family protein [Bryobacteraceae bacterium]|nr:type II CAAX endopeptidase family protein [Bryobacteraceae bacterium]
MKQRLRASDFRFIAICLALLGASTWFSVNYFQLAFPEASIDFRVSRGQAQLLAQQLLAGFRYDTAGYRAASRFSFDDDAKTFLEREAGLERASQWMGSRLHLWRWSFRWFRPQHKEEFRAEITPGGEFAGFQHLLAENAARPAVSDQQARAAAEGFLSAVLHLPLSTLDFVDSSTLVRPARVDRVFTWKERGFDVRGATHRLEITMLGGEIGGYREYLKIPDQWTRDYQRLRSQNDVAQYLDTAAVLALALGMVVVIVLRVRGRQIRWRRAASVGLIGMALSLCAYANQFPLREFNYPTTDSYASFIARSLLEGVLGALSAGGLLFFLAAAAEPLYREFFPAKISLGHLFDPRGLRTKSFFLGSILGLSLTGIFIAYQTGFYILAYRWGAWSPADVPYSDLLNTRLPWLYVLFGGFLPAVSEEFAFRMFAIPFLRKLVRLLPLAVVLAGFLWGFGHAGYPQQPFYIRGVEVGIGGVALGVIMLRWGILPTLVWHYSVDAMYSAMLLLRSPSVYFRLSGAASAGIMLIPVAFALLAYWRRGGFEPETDLLNAADLGEPAPPEPAAAPPAPLALAYGPLSVRLRALAVVLGAAGLLLLWIPIPHLGDSPVYRLGVSDASSAAARFLRAQGLDPASFRHVTFPDAHWGGDDSLTAKYFLERRPVPQAAALFADYRPIQHWVARYFRPLDREEILVSIHPETGRILGFSHTFPEDRPGASLPPEATRQIAARFAAAQGIDVGAMDLQENASEKKKARLDYTMVWEARPGDPRNLEQARFRVEVGIAGGQVSSLRSFWKIPEAYARARSRRNALSNLLGVLRLAVFAGLLVYGIVLLIQNLRQGKVRWAPVFRVAAPAALVTAMGPLLLLPLLLRNYNTAIPLATFQAIASTGVLMSLAFGFLVLTAATALITSSYPETLAAWRAPHRQFLKLDAAAAAFAALGLAAFFQQASSWLMARFHGLALYSVGSPGSIAGAAPSMIFLASAVRDVILYGALLVLVLLVIRRLPRRWLPPLALAALTAFLPTEIHTAGEFLLAYAIAILAAACALLFCLLFARRNPLAYALSLWVLALLPGLEQLFSTSNPALRVQAFVLTAVLAASLVWTVVPAREKRPVAEGAAV